ncbi:pyrroloquinoline quinone biosynthesis protein PqqF [Pseudomonas subflava]|uniref:pyrroloquinoline quinone biosynthesis protein PqqF n=1 Tax=Pseudomonas subflava TaxID=2952933 RepID=UPI00207A0507|nr:pyrroloquinoline quinone biosynthesis protein PqqF [Pseudomonas subflava]
MTDCRPEIPRPVQRLAAGGCRVAVISRPTARRACLIVEVAAGSHDEPAAWPGLAHFLEHVLFLGGESFAGDQRLMPFVQACGGRVNASTGARLTEYHCEVPAEHLEDAAQRLIDMLARPLLQAEAQRGEREVLQAEYLARGADPQQQGLCALLDALAPGHPAHAFVAGNGASLALERDEFGETLLAFHRRCYRAGNCRLMLVGPQDEATLLTLGERLAAQLPAGAADGREASPALLPLRARHWHLGQAGAPRLWLGLVLQGPREGFAAALAWLEEILASDLPGSLQQQLREAGLIDGWQTRIAYRHADQAILALEVAPVEDDDRACADLRHALLEWLAAFAGQAPWSAERETLAAERPWQLDALAPLELGRFWLQHGAALPDEAALACLQALLVGCDETALISVRASANLRPAAATVCGFALHLAPAELPPAWALPVVLAPPFNPLLQEVPEAASECPAALRHIEHSAQQATLLLRWSWPTALPGACARLLQRRLLALAAAAQRLGMRLVGEALAGDWQLRCEGPAHLLPAALRALLPALADSTGAEVIQAARLQRQDCARRQAQMPVRRLLDQLPRAVAGLGEAGADEVPEHADGLWQGSRWHGLLLGPAGLASRLAGDLARLPGQGDAAPRPSPPDTGRVWREYPRPADGDHALLVFAMAADAQPATEAAWRWLGQWLAPAFHRRMREELQLGYGLFSGFRQVEGRAGLLFAIQSPHTDPAALLAHLESFLDQQLQRLNTLSTQELNATAQPLAARLQPAAMEPEALAELLWQWRLAPSEAPPQALPQAVTALTPAAVSQALAALREARGGWLVLTH